MRLFSLLLILVIAAWSQTASQQSQPPIVVQIQQPPANPLMHLLDLVIPGIIGAAIAFLGVWLTNMRNTKEKQADRKHDLAKIDRQNGFTLKRDLLLRLNQAMFQQALALRNWADARCYYEDPKGRADPEATKRIRDSWFDYMPRRRESWEALSASSLGISHDLWKAGEKLLDDMEEIRKTHESHFRYSDSEEIFKGIDTKLDRFMQSCRLELGIVQSEPETNAPTAST